MLEKGIAINKVDKFRNQVVTITVYVPVGKQIRVNKGIGWPVHIGNRNWDDNWNDDYYDSEEDIRWQSDVDYIMKTDGLYTLDGRRADGWNDRDNGKKKDRNSNNGKGYRYDEFDKKADSLRNVEEIRRQKKLDSLEKEQQKIDSAKEKIENRGEESPAPVSMMRMPVNDLMVEIK